MYFYRIASVIDRGTIQLSILDYIMKMQKIRTSPRRTCKRAVPIG